MTEKKLNKTIKLTVYLYTGSGGKDGSDVPVKVVYNTGSIRVIEDEARGIKSTCAFPFGTRNDNDNANSILGAMMKALETAGIKMVNTYEDMDYEIEKHIAEENYEKAKRERDRVLSKKQNI